MHISAGKSTGGSLAYDTHTGAWNGTQEDKVLSRSALMYVDPLCRKQAELDPPPDSHCCSAALSSSTQQVCTHVDPLGQKTTRTRYVAQKSQIPWNPQLRIPGSSGDQQNLHTC
ncbi:hypothetical protein V1264_002914 [Littorina saxatilis]|uniref:Uncharacterized protein n=1 Tax=Littorina saxatilis TaxID=31220 RepID=A0AAN9B4G3_9CAEN